MSTKPKARPQPAGDAAVRSSFFPDRERLYEEMTAAAQATGRRHLTVAFTIDQILDRMRAQLSRPDRQRFDRRRSATEAELLAGLSLEHLSEYAYERATTSHGGALRPARLRAYAAAHGHHDRHRLPLSLVAACKVDAVLADIPPAARRRLAGERDALIERLTKGYERAVLTAWEPDQVPS
ncbi:hypothetical protein [Devosia sp.]|uniref:hypothetical protein n=1 Tax=Devosia sp. TaxID=1871048 RepID=UPI003F725B5C